MSDIVDQDDCELCDGCGEVHASTKRAGVGQFEDIACPLCLQIEKDAEIKRLRTQVEGMEAELVKWVRQAEDNSGEAQRLAIQLSESCIDARSDPFLGGCARALRAEHQVEEKEKTLDLVETNARVQAKLLADTARERDELRAQVERQRSGLSEARSDFLACAEVFDELDNPKGYNMAVGAAGQIECSFSSDDTP